MEKRAITFYKFNCGFRVIQVCYELNHENGKREAKGLPDAMDFFGLNRGLKLITGSEDEFDHGDKKIVVSQVWNLLPGIQSMGI